MQKRSIFASLLGNIIEWYDFSLYVYLAPVIADHYFPARADNLNLLYTFVIFALGFFVRPIGSAFFGHWGDRIGRAKILKITIILMSVPALIIAVLPTYNSIGFFATLLLLLCRISQGFAIGGEMAGTIIYLTESAKKDRRAFLSSLANQSSNVGVIFATGMCALLAFCLPKHFFTEYGWRFAFLIGGLAGLLGIGLRNTIQESALFSLIQEKNKNQPHPLWTVIRHRKKVLARVFLLLTITAAGNYILMGYFSTYLHVYLHYSLASALQIQLIFILISIVLIPCFAVISDRIGRRRCLLFVAIGYLACTFPCFYLLNLHAHWWYVLPLILIYCVEQSTVPTTIVEMVPAQARYSTISIAYNITMALVGGTAAAVTTWLIERFHNTMMIAYYLIGAALISSWVICTKLPKTFGHEHDLSQ